MAGITAAAITVACITTVVIMRIHRHGGITVAYTEDMDTTPVITGAGIIIRTLDTFGTAVGTSMASVPAGGGRTITMSSYGFAAEHLARTREGPAITGPSRSHDMPAFYFSAVRGCVVKIGTHSSIKRITVSG